MNSWYICIILLFILAIIETILNARWNKFYFLYGIPVFRKTIEIQNLEKASAEIIYLINHIDTIKKFRKYTGHIFDENTFFFRKKMVSSGRNNFDDIKGIIFVDAENREIVVKGSLGYTFILGVLIVLLMFINAFDSFTELLIPVSFIVIMLIISYLIERRKYNLLVDEITERIK